MRDQVRESIATKAWARWTVLAIVSFTMMAGYIVAKEMSPLQFMLEKTVGDGGMGWTSGEFGIFAGSRGFFNVFLLMLFVGGIILDKMGVRFTGILSCVLMLAGSAAVYGSITLISPEPCWAQSSDRWCWRHWDLPSLASAMRCAASLYPRPS